MSVILKFLLKSYIEFTFSLSGAGGDSPKSPVICPAGYTRFISICLKKSSSTPPSIKYENAKNKCPPSKSLQLVVPKGHLVQIPLRIYASEISSQKPVWIGLHYNGSAWLDPEGDVFPDNDGNWIEGSQSGTGNCIIMDPLNGYKWKKVDCDSTTASYLCQLRQPKCPDGYVWLSTKSQSSCFKIHDKITQDSSSGTQMPSLYTANKLCLEDGTKLAMPESIEDMNSLKEFFRSSIPLFKGKKYHKYSAYLGLQQLKQRDAQPSSCSDCDWPNGYYSSWSQQLYLNHFLTTMGVSDTNNCFKIIVAGNMESLATHPCIENATTDESFNTMALCEYRLCKTSGFTENYCQFPFRFGGRLYDTCITLGREDKVPWCSTKVILGTNS